MKLFKLVSNLYLADLLVLILAMLVLGSNYALSLDVNSFKLIVLFVWAIIIPWNIWKKNGFSQKAKFKDLLLGLFIGLIVAIFGLVFLDTNFLIGTFEKSAALLELIIYVLQKSAAEEFVFRLILVDYLSRLKMSNIIIVITQGVVFGLFHYARYQDYVLGVMFATVIGWLMGTLRVKQKNLLGAIISHTTINLIFLLYWYL